MTEDTDDFSNALNVPFIGHELMDYGGEQNRSELTEELIKREFGDLSQLIVSERRVELDGKALIDLDQGELDDADSLFSQIPEHPKQKQDPAIVAEFDSQPDETSSGMNLESVFRLRRTENGKALRIAVQTSLLHSQTNVLRQLIKALSQQPSESIEIDLSFCDDMSISGIGMLLLIQKNTAADNQHITIRNGKPQIMQLLKWAGMECYFTLEI